MSEQEESRILRKVPVALLQVGMRLPDDIYSSDGKALLIRAGEEVTEHIVERLNHMSDRGNCVMTYDTSYRMIYEGRKTVDEPLSEAVSGSVEERVGYTSLKNTVKILLNRISVAAEAETEAVTIVASDVMQKINVTDFFDLFRCIDMPRQMDEGLQRHSLNVAFLNGMMGYWMEFSDEEIRQLVVAGLLHDVGKTRIPEEILMAPRKLTAEEREIINRHPVYSYEILRGKYDPVICDVVRHHHEKIDGNGYPDGLAEEEISLFTRITAISDVYDAMASARSYKEAHLPFDILEEMTEDVYKGLDRKLIAVFVKNMIRHFKNSQVIMSDGTVGVVAYIPPNDLKHPIVVTEKGAKQTDEAWYCREVSDELYDKKAAF